MRLRFILVNCVLICLIQNGVSLNIPSLLTKTGKLKDNMPSSPALIPKRGGGSKVQLTPQLIDCTAQAATFFGSVRVPASLIAGASFGQLFTLTKRIPRTTTEKVLISLHNAQMLIAFMLALSTVIISTAANTSILHGAFDAFALNGYQFLNREFGLQFITCRIFFFFSCLSFLSGVFQRMIMELELFLPGRRDALLAISMALGGAVLGLTSFVNTTLYCWDDMGKMAMHLLKMLIRHVFEEKKPLMLAALICEVMAIGFTGKLVGKVFMKGVRPLASEQFSSI